MENKLNNKINKEQAKNAFIKSFNLPNGQAHFKLEQIKAIDRDVVTLKGKEAMSNAIVDIRITRDMFDKIADKHPEQVKPLIAEWNKGGRINDHSRDSCEPINRELL